MFLSLSYDNWDGKLAADAIIGDRGFRSIAIAHLDGLQTTPELIKRLNEFISTVRSFARDLPPPA
jgi:hypothetical protein